MGENEDMRLTAEEETELAHWSMYGSDGYPIDKIGRGWHVRHFPTVYKTKRAAVEQWERYINVLIARKGAQRQAEWLADHATGMAAQ